MDIYFLCAMVGKRIKSIRKLKCLTQKQFADSLFISQNFLSEVESGKAKPSLPLLALIEYRYNVKKEWLLKGKGELENAVVLENTDKLSIPELKIITLDEVKEKFNKSDRLEDFVPVPLLSDKAAAGQPAYINENDIEGYAIIYRAWVKNEKMHTAVRIKGDSMGPMIMDGYIVGIDHSQKDPASLDNKIVAAKIDNGITIKYFSNDKHCWMLYSSNRHYPPIHIRKEDGPCPIIGKIAWWWGTQE
jgi:SOS-response transcriptional repressor LexA/DNA-binding XRE family transcriptional regulator